MNSQVEVLGPPQVSPHLVQLLAVSVGDIRVMADIGILPHEIGRPQPLIADVTLHLACPVPSRIEDTVDYAVLVEAAVRLGRERNALIETFAHRLALHCLEDPRVEIVDVRVQKPEALQNGVASARVVLRRLAGFHATSSSSAPGLHINPT